MDLEKALDYKGYKFKYDDGDALMLKTSSEIEKINEVLYEASPEFDYEGCQWYVSHEKFEELKYKKLFVDSHISWHVGLPFYRVKNRRGQIYSIAEFYLQKYKPFKPDSEGLTLHEVFQNIPEEEGLKIDMRVPIKVGEFDAAFQKSHTWGSGEESLIFLASDVEDMSDEEIIILAKTYPRADMYKHLLVRRSPPVVYVSFGFHHITYVPGFVKK
jgi:hypothetical protein